MGTSVGGKVKQPGDWQTPRQKTDANDGGELQAAKKLAGKPNHDSGTKIIGKELRQKH